MFPTSTLFVGIVYFALMLGLFWFACVQRRRRREGRFPVPEDIRVMRLPGEQLSADLARLTDRFETGFLMLLGLPLLGSWVPLASSRGRSPRRA